MKKKIIGYKGFGKGLKCRDFQYEVGKEYKQDGEVKLCDNGFHFCENPLNVLNYYPLRDGNEFAEIEARGDVKTENDKSATNKIFIKAKLDLPMLIKASVDFIWNKASKGEILSKNSATSGDDAHSATSGNYAHSATSGNRANSATSGYGAHSATSGDDAIACSVGRKARAKASLGCWIVLAEWKEGNNFTDAKPIGVQAAQVDDKKIKADTFYELKDGKLVIAEDQND